jgi:hypothetical protein
MHAVNIEGPEEMPMVETFKAKDSRLRHGLFEARPAGEKQVQASNGFSPRRVPCGFQTQGLCGAS